MKTALLKTMPIKQKSKLEFMINTRREEEVSHEAFQYLS